MPVTVHKCTIKDSGPYVASAEGNPSMAYSYIELSTGEVLRNVRVFAGLDGKLDSVRTADSPIELHTLKVGKNATTLLAVRTPDGKYYATEPDKTVNVLLYCVIVVLVFAGVVTSGVFGLGLLLIAFAYFVFRKARLIKKANQHIESLPNVVFV